MSKSLEMAVNSLLFSVILTHPERIKGKGLVDLLHLGEWSSKTENSKVWWKNMYGRRGIRIFSFDMQKEYNLNLDYPYSLTPEEKEVFDKSEPFLADYYKYREYYGKRD